MRRASLHARRGVTLLEVLISILVLSVGLLAMAALIPVGIFEMSEANKLDQSGTLGRAAFRDLEIRGYLRPQMWMYLNIIAANNMRLDLCVDPQGGRAPVLPNSPVVVDPLMMAYNTSALGSQPNPSPYNYYATPASLSRFPYTPTGALTTPSPPVIPRLSVLPWFDPAFTVDNSPSTARYPSLGIAVADRIFRSTDDLTFVAPDGERKRPALALDRDANKNPLRSQFTGAYSWFATVAPARAEMAQTWPRMGYQPSAEPATRQFSVSVVVCHKRDLGEPVNRPAAEPLPGERMLMAELLGGGEVRLYLPAKYGPNPVPPFDNSVTEWTPTIAANANWLNVRPGQWLMLSGVTSASSLVIADWYRVVAVDDGSDVATNGNRYVTLHGPDWPPTTATFATIVEGVVGVYQKTITLDGTSPWSEVGR